MAVACAPQAGQLAAHEEDLTFPHDSLIGADELEAASSGASYVALDLSHGEGGLTSGGWFGRDGTNVDENASSRTSLASSGQLRPSEMEDLLEYNLGRGSADPLRGPPSSQSSSEGRRLAAVRNAATATVGASPRAAGSATQKTSLLGGLWACLGPVVHMWRKDKGQQVGRPGPMTSERAVQNKFRVHSCQL